MRKIGVRVNIVRPLVVLLMVVFSGLISTFANSNEIDPNAFYVDKDHILASNTNIGSEASPWKTIQHGINQLVIGQRLYVKASQTPYFEPYRASGSNWGGITVNVSGTSEDPIIIEGYPGERPVIDQQRGTSSLRAEDGSPDSLGASKVLTGFLLMNANNIVLRNFEITQTSASGVMFAPDRHNYNVIVEDMYIHHLYGRDNTGGIRLDHADDIIVRNNVIHDTYDIRYPNGNPYTDEQYTLHSGVHGYQPGNCIIENNLIYNVGRGVYQKAADADLKDSNTVRKNIFYNISYAAYSLDVQGTGSPPALNARFHENIVYNASSAVRSKLAETAAQSTGMSIYNNTFHNIATVTSLKGQTEIEFYNNIISSSSGINFATERTGRVIPTNGVAYMDNNLYFNHANKWMLERYAPDFAEWTSISSWQSAFSADQGVGLASDPGISSFEDNPLFVKAQDNDFHLEADSPARGRGRNGETLGAYGLGSQVIGVTDSTPSLVFANSFE